MIWQTYHNNLLALAEEKNSLFDYQRKAHDKIVSAINEYESRINLYGKAGFGKTFLGHYLHHQAKGIYFPGAQSCDKHDISPNSVIIVDNILDNRKSARVIYDNLLWHDAQAVILLTRKPIQDSIKRIHLSIDNANFNDIQEVLSSRLNITINNLKDTKWHYGGIWKFLKIASLLS